MRYTLAALALAGAAAASPAPQGITSAIAPSESAPAGCSDSHDGTFQITIVNVTAPAEKRSFEKRQKSGVLTLTLKDGILKDQAGRTGYVAANYQWQFDDPPQTGAIYTAGFSFCSNSTLALGDSAIWYQCLSGGFYNLYDRHWAPQCSPVYFQAFGGSAAVTQSADGQPAATTQVVASQIPDGQPQGVTQISDGQPQAPTGAPVTELADGQPQGPAPGAPVTQISDGQPQAPTETPVAPVTQISDGQPQAGTAAPAPSTPAAPVTQISDGQPQAPAGPPVTQIEDGQPQAPTGIVSNGTQPNATTPTVSLFTGAAAPVQLPQLAAAAIGMVGAVVLL